MNTFVDAILDGDPRALQAVDRLLEDMANINHDISERDLQILQMLSEGMSVRGAAHAFWIEEDTAYKALKRLYKKIGANNMAHAVAIAIREGMIQ